MIPKFNDNTGHWGIWCDLGPDVGQLWMVEGKLVEGDGLDYVPMEFESAEDAQQCIDTMQLEMGQEPYA